MNITATQAAKFWRLWSKAEAEVLPASASRAEREALRHETIEHATGKKSLLEVGRTGEFDRLMVAVADMAGDYMEASYWSVGTERRTVHMISECARQIGEIAGVPNGWAYCVGVFTQAHLPKSWEDISANLLAAVFDMLDEHRRRLLVRDWHWEGASAGQPLGFHPSWHYQVILGDLRLIRHPVSHAAVA